MKSYSFVLLFLCLFGCSSLGFKEYKFTSVNTPEEWKQLAESSQFFSNENKAETFKFIGWKYLSKNPLKEIYPLPRDCSKSLQLGLTGVNKSIVLENFSPSKDSPGEISRYFSQLASIYSCITNEHDQREILNKTIQTWRLSRHVFTTTVDSKTQDQLKIIEASLIAPPLVYQGIQNTTTLKYFFISELLKAYVRQEWNPENDHPIAKFMENNKKLIFKSQKSLNFFLDFSDTTRNVYKLIHRHLYFFDIFHKVSTEFFMNKTHKKFSHFFNFEKCDYSKSFQKVIKNRNCKNLIGKWIASKFFIIENGKIFSYNVQNLLNFHKWQRETSHL